MKKKSNLLQRLIIGAISAPIIFNLTVAPTSYARSSFSALNLPVPGTMVSVSKQFVPTLIRGVIFSPINPFQFNFLIDTGNANLKGNAFKAESEKLIKYFLAVLTIPEDDLWVNLSPYEKERIIPAALGTTELGVDMLAQDCLLKQLSASLCNPKSDLGKRFWRKVRQKAYTVYGTTKFNMNAFNKVWVVPDKAVVHEQGNSIFILDRHLKVMLEEDYLALKNSDQRLNDKSKLSLSSKIFREIIIPEIEKEINEGKNFALLRQMYNSMILATWYKKRLRENLLGKIYIDQNKIDGIDIKDKKLVEHIYNQYIESFRKGAYNVICKEYDKQRKKKIHRRYFSGGMIGVKQSLVSPPTGDFKAPVTVKALLPVGEYKGINVRFASKQRSSVYWSMPFGDYAALIQSIKEKRGRVTTRPVLIGIGGGSGAGKTTFSEDVLTQELRAEGKNVVIIHEDDFSKKPTSLDRTLLREKDPEKVRKVLLQIKNGEHSLAVPKSGTRGMVDEEEWINLQDVDFVIYEGLYALNSNKEIGNYNEFMDITIYLQEANVEDRKKRRYEQENNKSNPRTGAVMDTHWENIQTDHNRYVQPSLNNAQFVVHVDSSFNYVVEEILERRSNVPPMSALLRKAQRDSNAIFFVCPHSQLSLDTAIKVGKKKKWPLVFLYSRKQIDNDEFGAGHVFGWNQKRCVRDIAKRLKELGYNRKVYFYRDHGGPWQRTEEMTEKMSEELAMQRAKASFLGDLEAGFVAFHIDASKSPFNEEWDDYGKVKNEIMVRRTVELIAYIEEQRQLKNIAPVTYEVGGEWQRWDDGSASLFDDFLTQLKSALAKNGLKKVMLDYIAMNPTPNNLTTGTQQKSVDKQLIAELVAVARKHNMAIKYHNGDYMSIADRAEIGKLGVNAVNIAPEFSVVYQTQKLLAFTAYEEQLLASPHYKTLNLQPSRFREVLTNNVLRMVGKRLEDFNPTQLGTIIENKGHYAYNCEEVIQSVQKLSHNIKILDNKVPLEKQRDSDLNLNWNSMQEELEQAMSMTYAALEQGRITMRGEGYDLVAGNSAAFFVEENGKLRFTNKEQFQIAGEEESADYISMTYWVAENISLGNIERAILVADSESSAMAMSIAANRFEGTRAALCRNPEQAEHTRGHNHANILVVNKASDIDKIVSTFVNTPFKADRKSKVDRIDKNTDEGADPIKNPLVGEDTKVIPIASDYGGFKLKKQVIKELKSEGYQVLDLGTFSADKGDYPDYGKKVARLINSDCFEKGIVICKTGIGMSMVVNRYPNVRGALCTEPTHSRIAREYCNANVLVMSSLCREFPQILHSFFENKQDFTSPPTNGQNELGGITWNSQWLDLEVKGKGSSTLRLLEDPALVGIDISGFEPIIEDITSINIKQIVDLILKKVE